MAERLEDEVINQENQALSHRMASKQHTQQQKSILRREILKWRSQMDCVVRKKDDELLFIKVLDIIAQFAAQDHAAHQLILLYASYHGEADTKRLFTELTKKMRDNPKLERDVAFPKVITSKETTSQMEFFIVKQESDMEPGAFGIPEPIVSQSAVPVYETYDSIIMIMPGAVYDYRRNRIGYGGGYYDRFISRLQRAGLELHTVAIGYDGQVLDASEAIPALPEDIKPDLIITPNITIK